MTLVCLLLLALPAVQSASDVAVLHRPDPEWLEAYSASGQLLWTVAAPEGSLPSDLTPENAHGLIDGSWQRTAAGSWRLRGAGSGSVAAGAAPPPCIVWDGPSPIAGPPPGSSAQSYAGPTLHDSGGDAWVVLLSIGATDLLTVARSNRHTGTWGAPVTIATGQFDWPDTTIAPNDDITVVWRELNGSLYELHAARYTTAGGWTAPVLVHSSAEFIQNFDVLATAQNDVILAFHQGQPSTGPVATLVAVFDHAAGAWGPATVVSPPGIKGGFCGLRRSPDLAHVALGYVDKDSPGAGGIFHHAWNGVTKTFAPATVVPGSSDVWHDFGFALEEMAFAVGNDGSSTLFWLRKIGAAETIMGSRYEAGAWGPPAPLLAVTASSVIEMPLQQQSTAVSPAGRVLCVWAFETSVSLTYDLFPLLYVPGQGFQVEPPLATIVLQPPAFVSRSKLVFYAGERATVVTNDDTALFANHWNGAEWGTAEIPVPSALDLTHTLSAGAGEALIVDDTGPEVRSTWQRGTTAFADLGGGTPGTAGVPHFDGFCDQVVGQPVTFQLTGAARSAPLITIVGSSQVNFPFAGGIIVPAPTLLLPGVTDAAGELNLPILWPAGAGSLFTFYYQVAVLDPAALEGVALSNAMAGTTP